MEMVHSCTSCHRVNVYTQIAQSHWVGQLTRTPACMLNTPPPPPPPLSLSLFASVELSTPRSSKEQLLVSSRSTSDSETSVSFVEKTVQLHKPHSQTISYFSRPDTHPGPWVVVITSSQDLSCLLIASNVKQSETATQLWNRVLFINRSIVVGHVWGNIDEKKKKTLPATSQGSSSTNWGLALGNYWWA